MNEGLAIGDGSPRLAAGLVRRGLSVSINTDNCRAGDVSPRMMREDKSASQAPGVATPGNRNHLRFRATTAREYATMPSDFTQYDNPLIARYASPRMSEIWSPQRKFSTWRRLWVALAEAEAELGLAVTAGQIAELKAHLDDIDSRRPARAPCAMT